MYSVGTSTVTTRLETELLAMAPFPLPISSYSLLFSFCTYVCFQFYWQESESAEQSFDLDNVLVDGQRDKEQAEKDKEANPPPVTQRGAMIQARRSAIAQLKKKTSQARREDGTNRPKRVHSLSRFIYYICPLLLYFIYNRRSAFVLLRSASPRRSMCLSAPGRTARTRSSSSTLTCRRQSSTPSRSSSPLLDSDMFFFLFRISYFFVNY